MPAPLSRKESCKHIINPQILFYMFILRMTFPTSVAMKRGKKLISSLWQNVMTSYEALNCTPVLFCFSWVFFSAHVRFCFPSVLTMRKNALRHEPLSTQRQSPTRATDCPASRWRKKQCLLSLQGLRLRCVHSVCVYLNNRCLKSQNPISLKGPTVTHVDAECSQVARVLEVVRDWLSEVEGQLDELEGGSSIHGGKDNPALVIHHRDVRHQYHL